VTFSRPGHKVLPPPLPLKKVLLKKNKKKLLKAKKITIKKLLPPVRDFSKKFRPRSQLGSQPARTGRLEKIELFFPNRPKNDMYIIIFLIRRRIEYVYSGRPKLNYYRCKVVLYVTTFQ
jgi:hypothetical protein